MGERGGASGLRKNAPRVAASSYLNTVPLVWSFTQGSMRREVELVSDAAPAKCGDMLARGEVEAALVPVIEYQRIPELLVVPNVCVGSRKRVRSVVLVMKDSLDGLKDVRSVALDTSSRTSAALIRVIFREFVGSEPAWMDSAPDVASMLEAADAALIIGDPGMTFSRRGVVVYDLAELWRERTGLGFVFAMWMAREGAAERVRRVDFAGARDEGLEHVEEIAAAYAPAVGLPPGEIKEYLLDNISFELNEEMRAGLSLFYRLAARHGVVPEARPLRMLGE
ncbi:MAG TPA: menaquinone biosynthesis protein [Pyrinomonadaceae bacterium]|nr:menaquinone biosynthesis protein [Pyrinomonadaceae bacterium]